MCSLLEILEILQKHCFLYGHLDCAHLVLDFPLLVKAQSVAEPSGMPCFGNRGVLKGKTGLSWDPRSFKHSDFLAKEQGQVPGWSWGRQERKDTILCS